MVSTKEPRQSPRNSVQMFPLIRRWESSGLSQKDFCARQGIKSHVFWYWLRRYRERYQGPKKAVKGFIPVEVEEQASEQAVLAEIVYENGTRLILKERVGVKFLQGLLPKPVKHGIL
jgi:transposase-like protein